MVGQALTGKRQSIPKIVKLQADDNKKVVFKNVGNNHTSPFIWADTISVTAADSAVIADGVVFQGKDLATYGNVVVTPRGPIGTEYYVEHDTVNNIVTLKLGTTVTADFDVQIILGGNSAPRFIEDFVK
jgi:hypothetical protein